MSKRPLDSGSSGRGYGDMEFVPLGAGNEVGRSCGVLRYKGKTVMLDCGIHPGKTSYESLPIFDSVNLEEVDLLLVTHFHLDHAGALPYLFTEHIKFQGRIFMTHPTKAVLKMMIYDSIRVGFDEESLYTEDDMDRCFRKIEIIDFNQTLEVDGIKFTCYNAGHVLGGAMFAVDIAGVNVLYTGDYSLEEDRHLSPAAIPNQKKTDVLIVESTSGLNEHEDAVRREKRFLAHVEKVLKRGGRLLIPVFALGRAQELLLMMEEHWRDHPELQRYPIFYASKMAARALKVYHTYVNMMNAKVRATLTVRNPFKFDHITNLPFSNYDDDEPAVVLASPGMLQSGVSRKLCERWCGNPLVSKTFNELKIQMIEIVGSSFITFINLPFIISPLPSSSYYIFRILYLYLVMQLMVH
jgi:cleavage and polyadenylation specificity factor subunit 3